MNTKGFTLVELLMTIVILALILLIAVPTVNNVSEAVRKRQRENKIKNIEIAASKYAFDTGATLIFVDELITEGYIESDDEEGNLNDPLNNIRLNCYAVEMEKTSDYYNATFKEDNNYDNDGECDLSKLQEDNAGVNIEVLNNGTSVSPDSWLTGDVTLKVYSNSISINCNTNKCEWFSSSGANVTGKDEISLSSSGIIETKYTFQYTIYDNDSSELKRYKVSVNLKVDNSVPTINESEITITDQYEYTSTKNITIFASDGNGSGISGYYLALSNGQTCYSTDISYQGSNIFTINSNGDYLICVKDNVGNISSYSGLSITYIE